MRAAADHAISIANGTADDSESANSGGASGGGGGGLFSWFQKVDSGLQGRDETDKRNLLAHALAVTAGAEPKMSFELLVAAVRLRL